MAYSIVKLSTVLFILTWQTGLAATNLKDEIERNKRNSADIKKNIEEDEEKVKQLKIEKKSVLAELNRIDRRIDRQNGEIESYNKQINRGKRRIKDIRADLADLEGKLISGRERLGKRLRWIYKSGKTNQWAFLLRAESLADFQRRLGYMRSIAAADAALIDDIRDHRQALSMKREELEVEAGELDFAKTRLEKSRRDQISEKKRKRDYVRLINRDEAALLKRIAEEREREQRLDSRITALRKEKSKIDIALKAGYGEFKVKKGYLPWPVVGKVIRGFGARKVQGLKNTFDECWGVKIKAPHGTPVNSVATGNVIFSDWSNYGKTIIVDHGAGFLTCYMHLSSINVTNGQEVKAGSLIGAVGSTDSWDGDVLYFQLRQGGMKMNPMSWLIKN